MDFEKLKSILEKRGEPQFRWKQICEFYFKNSPNDWADFTILAKNLRKVLQERLALYVVETERLELSKIDGTKKALLKLANCQLIETVHIPLKEGVDTACVSCQVGCGIGCTFCATGQMGFKSNLTYSEIVDQIVFWNRILKPEGKKINRVVFMGMGEPMLNYDQVIEAIKFLNKKETMGMAFRRFTISSSGIVHKLYDLMNEDMPGIKLAISLHAPNDELRSSIMPINKTFPLKKLMQFCREYALKKQEKIFFEYVMIDGVNNFEVLAEELATLLKTIPLAQVNLIHYHPTGAAYEDSPIQKILNFQKILKDRGVLTFIRKSSGIDISAACGQLKVKAGKESLKVA